MSKYRLQYLADFDTSSGVIESGDAFQTESPGLEFTGGTYLLHDAGNMDNFGITYWVGFNTVLNSKHRIVLGPDGSGAGRAIDIIMSASEWLVRYVSCSTYADGSPTVLDLKSFKIRGFKFENFGTYPVKIYLNGPIMKVFFNDVHCFDISNFTYSTTKFALTGIDTSNKSYVSDLNYMTNQVFHGAVTLSGQSQGADGRVICIRQSTMQPVDYVRCDANGEYLVLVQEDSLNNDRYLIYAYVDGQSSVQPKGVANLTI